MRTLINNIILTPGVENEKHIPFICDACIQIDGSVIRYAGAAVSAPEFEADKVIDGRGRLAMPGLVNAHAHTPMTLLRAAGSDLPLQSWLQECIFILEKKWTDEGIKVGTELGILEMLRYGTTAFNDMYVHMDMMSEAVRDSGMRALLGYGVIDFDNTCRDLEPGIELVEKWNHAADDRIRISLDPHCEATTTPAVLEKIRDYALRHDIPVHMHINETKKDMEGCHERQGCCISEYLDRVGLLDCKLLAAHCVWTEEEDFPRFARKNFHVLHNPISNLKLASGIAPVAKMLECGIQVALGTDGVASNNNLNLWEEMRLMPLLQKGVTLDPTVVTPAQTLSSATFRGAQALGFENAGLLKEGWMADLILVDIDHAHMVPAHDLEANLIYSSNGADVSLTMVNGKVLYEDGLFTTLNEKEILRKARIEADKLVEAADGAGYRKQ